MHAKIEARVRQYEIETAAPREWDDPAHTLTPEVKAAIRANHEKIKGAKDDGFVPFDQSIVREGDAVRLKDGIVRRWRPEGYVPNPRPLGELERVT